MRSPQILLVTSCKGGTGKSTVAVNLASALTELGKKILLIDCDFGNRCLDLLLGCEDDVVYDICDVALERIPPSKAIMKLTRAGDTIQFVSAPAFYENEITSALFKNAVQNLVRECSPDLVLLDTSGGMPSIEVCAPSATGALIIVSHQPVAIRAAEKTGNRMAELGVKELRLIINNFDFHGSITGERFGIGQIIDMSHIRTIGVVPYDYNLELAQESGIFATELTESNCSAAFRNIAKRLTGDSVPLFTNFKHIPIKKLRHK